MRYRRKLIDSETLKTLKSNLTYEPVCDFCSDSHPVFIYAAKQMSTGMEIPCWRWCACWDCAEGIEKDEWEDIRMRLLIKIRHELPEVPPDLLKLAVREALVQFNKYVIQDRD